MLAMLRPTLIALCIAALSILLAPALHADQCSELTDEYNAGWQRLDNFNRQQIEKAKKLYSGGAEPSLEQSLEFACTDVRLRLLELRRELETAKRLLRECAAQLPLRLPSGKLCDVACDETLVTDTEKWIRKNCEGH
jgi:hypothetical protein